MIFKMLFLGKNAQAEVELMVDLVHRDSESVAFVCFKVCLR